MKQLIAIFCILCGSVYAGNVPLLQTPATHGAAVTWPFPLPGYNQRVKLSFDASDVDANLASFQVMVWIGPSVGIGGTNLSLVTDEIGTNWQKVAFTTDDGATQLYADNEFINAGTSNIIYHVNVPSILTNGGTAYFYYDGDIADNTTYIGRTGSAAASNVWTNVTGRWALSEDGVGTRFDSTWPTNNAIPQNYDGDEATSVGKIDGADDLGGVDDALDVAAAVISGTPCTMMAWVVPGDQAFRRIISAHDRGTANNLLSMGVDSVSTKFFIDHYDGSDGSVKSLANVPVGSWSHVAGVFNSDANRVIYINGAINATSTVSQAAMSGIDYLGFGFVDWSGGPIQYWDGRIDEVRLWSRALSAAEIKAHESTQDDTFITYTPEP